MDYNTRVVGSFTITPPLTWPEIKDSPYAPDNILSSFDPELMLEVTEEQVDTPDGPLLRRTAGALVMREIDEYRAHRLTEMVQKAVDAFPGHTFSGYLHCEGQANADMWRVHIKDGKAVEVHPDIVWPEP
jgi:hypothetical protein